MLSGTSVAIDKHTTASTPRPHILYSIKVTQNDGTEREVLRRYSEVHIFQLRVDDQNLIPFA